MVRPTGGAGPSLSCMRAVQITRFGGPEVLDVVDLPDPVPGDGEQLYEVSAAGINDADTHHPVSLDPRQEFALQTSWLVAGLRAYRTATVPAERAGGVGRGDGIQGGGDRGVSHPGPC